MKKLFTLFLVVGFSLSLSAQVFVDENFEGGLPSGWTIITSATDGGWLIGTANDLSSTYWGIDDVGSGKLAATNDDGCDCDKSNDILAFAALDLSAVTAIRLEFDLYFWGETYGGVTEKAYVVYSLDDGVTWIEFTELVGNPDWNFVSLDLNSVVGNPSVKVGIKYDDGGEWLYGCAIDNVKLFKPFDYDVKLDLDPIDRYELLTTMVPFTGVITNSGLQTITSVDITWTDGTNTYTDNLTGLNIAPGGTYNFTHSTPFEVVSAITYDIEFDVANPNGQPDEYDLNNSAATKVSGLAFAPDTRVIGEEATGTWCGWCPRGFVFMDLMEETYEDFIGIAVHNSDPMENAVYDAGLTSFPGFVGFPSVIVDRREVIDPQDLEAYFAGAIDRNVPTQAAITLAQIDPWTLELTLNAEATFATQMSASDYRFNVVLVENGVTGTGSAYDQVNYYSGGSVGPMGGWEDLADPVPAADMVYNLVGRDILGGWDGWDGTLDVVANDVVTGSWTYTVPEAWNYENMTVIFMVLDGITGEIHNAAESTLEVFSNTNEIDNLQRFVLSPNPTSGMATLDLQLGEASDVRVELINSIGQTLSIQQVDNSFGDLFQFNLGNQPAGAFFVKVTVGDQVRVERLMVTR